MAEEREQISEGASSSFLRGRREENVDGTQPSHNLLNQQNNERIEMVEGRGSDSAATAVSTFPGSSRSSCCSWKQRLIVVVLVLVVLGLTSFLVWFFVFKEPTVAESTTQQTTTELDNDDDWNLWRVYGGENAAKDAWPWQALVTRKSRSMSKTLGKTDNILGGGSIINELWILTAAHVLDDRDADKLAVFVGVYKRPQNDEAVTDPVEAHAIGNYFLHPNFSVDTFNNDIALIKLGARLDSNMKEKMGSNHALTFKTSIKPVCLPCTGTCSNLLHLSERFNGGNLQITDEASNKEKCENEEKYLLSNQTDVIVTGFGHTRKSDKASYEFKPSRKLQEAPLKIEDEQTCKEGIEKIKDLEKEKFLKYTESMICCSPRIPGKETDACMGDSGGPIVEKVRYYVKDDNTKVEESFWVQVAIVSFGLGCGKQNTPGYYTNVANFIPWINATTNGIFQGPALDLTVVSMGGNATSSKVQVSWKLSKAYDNFNAQNIKEYNLYYSLEESSVWSQIMISDGANTTDIANLLLNKVYRYMIKAITTEGITLPPSRVLYFKNLPGSDGSDEESVE